MAVHEYRGLRIHIPDSGSEYKGYFEAAKQGRLVVHRCCACHRLRADFSRACPWCQSLQWEWQPVSGKGTIYSYQITMHSVLPGFRDWVPFPIVLVELDEQRAQPGPYEGLRITANLVDRSFAPEKDENVAIGKRVKVTFMDTGTGLVLPQFQLSEESPETLVWRYLG